MNNAAANNDNQDQHPKQHPKQNPNAHLVFASLDLSSEEIENVMEVLTCEHMGELLKYSRLHLALRELE